VVIVVHERGLECYVTIHNPAVKCQVGHDIFLADHGFKIKSAKLFLLGLCECLVATIAIIEVARTDLL